MAVLGAMMAIKVSARQAELLVASAGLVTATVVGMGVARADDGRYSSCVNAGIDTNNCHLIINQADETTACNMDVGHGHNLVMGFLIQQGYNEQMARVGAAIACR
jgi:hypothetical protein